MALYVAIGAAKSENAGDHGVDVSQRRQNYSYHYSLFF